MRCLRSAAPWLGDAEHVSPQLHIYDFVLIFSRSGLFDCMNNSQPTPVPIGDLTVGEIEHQLQSQPDNLDLKEDLAYALMNRYLYGTESESSNNESDLELIRSLLKELPATMALWHRAYIAHVDGKPVEAAEWFSQHAAYLVEEGEPISCDELYVDLLGPFDNSSQEFWTTLADTMQQICPDSGAAYTVQAESIFGEDVDAAMSSYGKALEQDSSYWWAAWSIASQYAHEKNWKSAENYYAKAFGTETGALFPELCFDYAWCMGKLKRFEEEEKLLRKCLSIDPDFRYALNNLGWSLYKRSKYGEALKIFDDAIKKGNDGKYPLRNRARTLEKLGRISEAVESWRRTGSKDQPSVSIQREVERLESLLQNAAMGIDFGTPHLDANEEEDDLSSLGGEAKVESPDIDKPTPAKRNAAQSEQLLEDMIEHLIESGAEVFGRSLRLYESADGLRGRQYIIPGCGRIDLFAEDGNSGDLVVIELKKAQSDDVVVGQIARYMTWVRENLAGDRKVVGIICVFGASPNLALAARAVPELEVLEYDLSFRRV